jgi:hypothetical protein
MSGVLITGSAHSLPQHHRRRPGTRSQDPAADCGRDHDGDPSALARHPWPSASPCGRVSRLRHERQTQARQLDNERAWPVRKVLRMDHRPELVSQALQQFCDHTTGMVYIPPGWDNGCIESFTNRRRKECLNRNHWNTLFEARVVICDVRRPGRQSRVVCAFVKHADRHQSRKARNCHWLNAQPDQSRQSSIHADVLILKGGS